MLNLRPWNPNPGMAGLDDFYLVDKQSMSIFVTQSEGKKTPHDYPAQTVQTVTEGAKL